jgi:hypothetical protein
VDLLAKQERLKSFYLPRQAVDMRRWRTTLPHLWWILAEDPSLPSFHAAFFDATPPELPPQRPPSFNFLGIQETKCPATCSLVDDIYRLGIGADGGHWGVELWLNLQQPIGYDGHTPTMISKQDVVVLHQDPRALINED